MNTSLPKTSLMLLVLSAFTLLWSGCWSSATSCTDDSDCFVGEQCISSQCLAPQSSADMSKDLAPTDQQNDLDPVDQKTDIPIDMKSSCQATGCPDDEFCNQDSGKCERGCQDDTQCSNGQTCDRTTNTCACPENTHQCADQCVSDFDVNSCGTRCEPCPGTADNLATCVQGKCEATCGANTLKCQGQCADCPNDPNAVSFMCRDTSCVSDQCKEGHLQCGGTCAKCPEAKGAKFACNGTSCVVDGCAADFKDCNGRCQFCPNQNIPNGEAVCSNGEECTVTCNGGYLSCGNVCTECPSGQNVLAFGCDAMQACVATSCAQGFVPCAQGCCRLQPPTPGAIPMTRGVLHALAIDRQDRPNIVYSGNDANATISLVQWNGIGNWIQQPLTAGRVGGAESFTIDAQNKGHMVFLSADLKKVRYGTNTSGAWTYTDITSVSDSNPTSLSVRVDTQNTPHVAIANGDTVNYGTLSPNGWRVERVYRSNGSKQGVSINFFQGLPRIGFRTAETSANIRYARRAANGQWDSSRISANGQIHRAEHVSLLMSPNPLVIFDNELTKRVETILFNPNTQQWEFYTLSNPITVSTDISKQGLGNARVNVPRNAIEVVYNDTINAQIVLLTLANNTLTPTFIGAANKDSRPALAVDTVGQKHISYIAPNTNAIVYGFAQ